MKRRWSTAELEGLIVLVTLGFALAAGAIGWFVGDQMAKAGRQAAPTVTTNAAGGLPAQAIGDPVKGAALFRAKGCFDCHSYNGRGGTDAPPLDSMAGHLSIRDVANMSGVVWNHLPQMLHHFEEEGIPVPTFQSDEMADLIAFLHSGSQPASTAGESETAGDGAMDMTSTQP